MVPVSDQVRILEVDTDDPLLLNEGLEFVFLHGLPLMLAEMES
jgi:hypothetical protein